MDVGRGGGRPWMGQVLPKSILGTLLIKQFGWGQKFMAWPAKNNIFET